ncbi:MAG: hypothetical protein AAF939_08355 [Planctomycetota bacterium]
MDRKNFNDSIANPRNRICDIVTETSQIRRVLAEPLPQPLDSDPPELRQKAASDRQRQLNERERFVLRYDRAIRALLMTKLGNSDKVEQVYAFFMQKCMEGKLQNYKPVEPETGKALSFRKYLKTVLRNCCYEYHRNNLREESWVQIQSVLLPSQDARDKSADEAFDQSLVETLFQRTLDSIKNTDFLFYTSLKQVIKAIYQGSDPPNSSEMAALLSSESGRPISETNARKIKSRANKLFASQLIAEVSHLIKTSDLDEIETALVDIGILKYCKKALAKMRESETEIE